MFKKMFVLLLLYSSLLLSGCAGVSKDRQFAPEWDTGYEVDYDELEASITSPETTVKASWYTAGAAAGFISPGVTLGGAALGGALAPVIGAAVFMASCSATKCDGHQPYGSILMSGNVVRGELFWPVLPFPENESESTSLIHNGYIHHPVDHNYQASFSYPKVDRWSGSAWGSWAFVADSEHDIYERYDLVDVYYPYNVALEREAIQFKKRYDGIVLHLVCKKNDDECMKKYKKENNNFILGRWKSKKAFLIDYEKNNKFPN